LGRGGKFSLAGEGQRLVTKTGGNWEWTHNFFVEDEEEGAYIRSTLVLHSWATNWEKENRVASPATAGDLLLVALVGGHVTTRLAID